MRQFRDLTILSDKLREKNRGLYLIFSPITSQSRVYLQRFDTALIGGKGKDTAVFCMEAKQSLVPVGVEQTLFHQIVNQSSQGCHIHVTLLKNMPLKVGLGFQPERRSKTDASTTSDRSDFIPYGSSGRILNEHVKVRPASIC